jgi:hypothetical protein
MTKARTGTFKEFQDFTLDVVQGKRKVAADDPKIWIERHEGADEAGPISSPVGGAKREF